MGCVKTKKNINLVFEMDVPGGFFVGLSKEPQLLWCWSSFKVDRKPNLLFLKMGGGSGTNTRARLLTLWRLLKFHKTKYELLALEVVSWLLWRITVFLLMDYCLVAQPFSILVSANLLGRSFMLVEIDRTSQFQFSKVS